MALHISDRLVDRRLWVLGAIPVFFAVTGLFGPATVNPATAPDAMVTVQALGAIAAILLWVRLDALQRKRRVSWILWLTLAGLTSVALPYYLLRSRGAGAGLRAIGWGLVVFSVTMLFYRLGSYLSAVI
jgi:predicted membrane channel-forming protein YqfA (hemolysin III family)